MAKLTRKLWVGIGAAAIAGAAVNAPAPAQHATHKAPEVGKGQGGDKSQVPGATETPAEGGEAYLTDGGPKDTRVRFYRDVELVRGHLLVGHELIMLGAWDEALPHFLHPTEELYGGIEKYLVLHNIPAFRRELLALAQAVKAKRQGAYEQASQVLEPKLEGAIGTVKRFMTPPPRYMARTAAELLKAAHSEYQSAIENGRFVKPVEYQDGRGFMLRAERLLEAAGPELKKTDAEAYARVMKQFAILKTAWPAPMPPEKPLVEPGALSALVSDIELHVSRF